MELAKSISEYAGLIDANVLQYTWPENFDKYRILLVLLFTLVYSVYVFCVLCVLHFGVFVVLLNRNFVCIEINTPM